VRQIKYGLLGWYNIAYRLWVFLWHFVFTYFVITHWGLKALAGTTIYVICWNIINTGLHYTFDVAFFKRFKVGR